MFLRFYIGIPFFAPCENLVRRVFWLGFGPKRVRFVRSHTRISNSGPRTLQYQSLGPKGFLARIWPKKAISVVSHIKIGNRQLLQINVRRTCVGTAGQPHMATIEAQQGNVLLSPGLQHKLKVQLNGHPGGGLKKAQEGCPNAKTSVQKAPRKDLPQKGPFRVFSY